MNKFLIGSIVIVLLAGSVFVSLQLLKGDDMSKKVVVKTKVQVVPTDTSEALPTETPADTIAPTATPANVKGASTEAFDPTKQYVATLHTQKGDIVIAFNKGQTPKTVENFVTLAQKNFYDNTIFHRTIKGFMIQGGDPLGTGTGGPGYKFDDESFTGEYTRGTVAMANAGPNTNGSQFFIMHADYGLPKNYTIFGHVTKGLEVVDAIATAPTLPSGEGSTPVNPVKITSVDVAVSK